MKDIAILLLSTLLSFSAVSSEKTGSIGHYSQDDLDFFHSPFNPKKSIEVALKDEWYISQSDVYEYVKKNRVHPQDPLLIKLRANQIIHLIKTGRLPIIMEAYGDKNFYIRRIGHKRLIQIIRDLIIEKKLYPLTNSHKIQHYLSLIMGFYYKGGLGEGFKQKLIELNDTEYVKNIYLTLFNNYYNIGASIIRSEEIDALDMCEVLAGFRDGECDIESLLNIFPIALRNNVIQKMMLRDNGLFISNFLANALINIKHSSQISDHLKYGLYFDITGGQLGSEAITILLDRTQGKVFNKIMSGSIFQLQKNMDFEELKKYLDRLSPVTIQKMILKNSKVFEVFRNNYETEELNKILKQISAKALKALNRDGQLTRGMLDDELLDKIYSK